MPNERGDIIAALNDLDTGHPRTYEKAEALAALVVRAYDYFSGLSNDPFHQWQMVKIAQAYGYICCGWLSAAANCVGLSFETNVSLDAWHLQKLEQEFAEIQPHLEEVVGSLRSPTARQFVLQRYEAEGTQTRVG